MARSIAELSRKEYELGKQTISLDELKRVHSALVEQRERAFAASRKKQYLVQARILDAAIAPFEPASPNKKLYLSLGFLLALILSVTAAFFVEYFDYSVHTAEDAQHCLGLPLLATIHDVHPRMTRQLKFVFKPMD